MAILSQRGLTVAGPPGRQYRYESHTLYNLWLVNIIVPHSPVRYRTYRQATPCAARTRTIAPKTVLQRPPSPARLHYTCTSLPAGRRQYPTRDSRRTNRSSMRYRASFACPDACFTRRTGGAHALAQRATSRFRHRSSSIHGLDRCGRRLP
ncbi:hypothetical protein BKA93DRAFT_798555 [Sparassis latifolia]